MIKFYLNSDHSIMGEFENGKVSLKSFHKNKRNANNLVSNLSHILHIEESNGAVIIKLNDEPYVKINTKSSEVKVLNELTSFETRLFARSIRPELLPYVRFKNKPKSIQTDVHTHFAATLSPVQLIRCGLGKGIRFTEEYAKKFGLNIQNLPKDDKGTYLLEDVIKVRENCRNLISAMKIDTSEQETFNKLEEIYLARGPFTKNPSMFLPILIETAKDARQNGITYMELSLSSIISNMQQLKTLENYLPEIENMTGVKLRFLGAMSRHSDQEWNHDEVERLKITAKSPYVVGCDFMAHETNPTSDFATYIKELARYAIINDPDFVIRVHAGENALFKANVRDVFLAVEEAHRELTQELGKELPYPQVRIGHGIYGFDEPPSYNESEENQKLSTEELCKRIKPIIEFNMSSNLALNNIDNINQIPIKKYLDKGIRVVLGTDGRGIYSTSIGQEMILAKEAGLTEEDFAKISQTELEIIENQNKRFLRLCERNDSKSEYISLAQKDIEFQYNDEVEKRNFIESQERASRLLLEIAKCGAVIDGNSVKDSIKGKRPILLTGSSHKHFPNIQSHPDQIKRIQIALDALVHAVDPNKAYFVTGGTNHGVEKELHQIAHRYNKEGNHLVVLGTLTEEAVKYSKSTNEKIRNSNKIEKDTITHAIIPQLNGKNAKRWFDLPDCTLDMVQSEHGKMVAIGGGSIVGDMILRAHNMGLDMAIMSDVEGASGDKSKSLKGNNYEFFNAEDLLKKFIIENPDMLLDNVTLDSVKTIVKQAEQRWKNEFNNAPQCF